MPEGNNYSPEVTLKTRIGNNKPLPKKWSDFRYVNVGFLLPFYKYQNRAEKV